MSEINPYDETYDWPESWLAEDLTGLSENNTIINEPHPIGECKTRGSSGDTLIISPYRGAFYGSRDLVVKYVNGSTETILSRTDYRLIGLDVGRTRVSSSEFGVYRFIQITCDTGAMNEGQLVVSYHAFGGQIDPESYKYLINLLNEATGGSGGGGGGSTSTVDTVARTNINTLRTTVDDIARRINYGVPASIVLPRETSSGWSPIAYSSEQLDDYIDFTKPSTLTGSGSFVIVSKNVHGVYNFSYEIIKNGSSYKVKLTCDVSNQKISSFDPADSGYFGTSSGGSSTAGNMTIPMFRMKLDTSAPLTGHRLVLEIGMLSDAHDNSYSIYIGDKTDKFLVQVADQTAAGQTFDAWEVGSTNSAGTVDSNVVLGIQDYYEIWRGNASMSTIEDVSWYDTYISRQYNVQNRVIPKMTENGYTLWPFVKSNIVASAITSFRADIYDRWQQKLIAATGVPTISNPYGTSSVQSVYACMNYFPIDNCLLEIFYTYTQSRAQLKLYASSGSNSYANKRFDLRSIYIK